MHMNLVLGMDITLLHTIFYVVVSVVEVLKSPG